MVQQSSATGVGAGVQQQLARMQACVRSLLLCIQEDPSRQGLLDTPKRVAKAMLAMTEGYRQDPAALLTQALFDEPDIEEGAGGLVLVRDIDFACLSQDTLLPFYGRAHIAYVPANGVVLGLSKLARLTKLCAKQLHTQGGLARQLLHVLQRQLQPRGALVVIQARHLDYTDTQPPQQRTSAAASGCLALPLDQQLQAQDAAPTAAVAVAAAATHLHCSSSSSSTGATLEEALELLGAPLLPQQVELLPDAADPLCLLQPGCSCTSSSSSSGRFPPQPLRLSTSADHIEVCDGSSSSSTRSGFASQQLATLPACATCGSTRLAPHLLRGMSASAAGGLDSPRAPVTPDPSENSDTDGSEQGSDIYCASLLLAGAELSDPSAASAGVAAAGGCGHFGAVPPAVASAAAAAAGSTVSMEAALLQLLAEAGVDTSGPGMQATARRHVMALLAATSGYHQEQPSRPAAAASSSSGNSSNCCCCCCRPSNGQEPLQQPQQQQRQQQQAPVEYRQYEHHIPFMSQCEHHMLPFHGTAHITYLLPDSRSCSRGGSCACCCNSSRDGCCQQQQRRQQPLSQAEAAQLVGCFTRRLQVQERITQQLASGVQQLLCPTGVMVVVQAVHMCMVARGVENHAGSTSTRAALGVFEARPDLRCRFLRHLHQQLQGEGSSQATQQQQQQQQQQQPGPVGAHAAAALPAGKAVGVAAACGQAHPALHAVCC